MNTKIEHSYFFPQPPEVVWDYLTKAELMELWLMKNDFKPIAGYDFQFNTRPMPNFDLDGIFYCKVLEIIPFKKLVYSWKTGPGNGKITIDSLVVWTLQPKEEGTELLLVHSGFKEADFTIFNAMDSGWLSNIKKIASLLNAAPHGTTNA